MGLWICLSPCVNRLSALIFGLATIFGLAWSPRPISMLWDHGIMALLFLFKVYNSGLGSTLELSISGRDYLSLSSLKFHSFSPSIQL